MKAHKVPATYLSGWEIPGMKDHIYVFYVGATEKQGTLKKYRDVKRITAEHSHFMAEDFYYIDLRIDGMDYKLQSEIQDFFNQKSFSITCVDDLCEVPDGEAKPIISIDSYEKYMKYKNTMSAWKITDFGGQSVSSTAFFQVLSDFVFGRVGKLVEEDYFAHYLENMWPDLKKSIISDVGTLNTGDPAVITREDEFLEFFALQYLRVDKRIKEIDPVIQIFERIFTEYGLTQSEIAELKKDGLLSSQPYFYGALLDAARGDKRRVNGIIAELKNKYIIDILEAANSMSFLTSTSPCIVSKKEGQTKTEFLFPLSRQYCVRFRYKTEENEKGKYYLLTDAETRVINRCVVADSDNVVFSELVHITNLV